MSGVKQIREFILCERNAHTHKWLTIWWKIIYKSWISKSVLVFSKQNTSTSSLTLGVLLINSLQFSFDYFESVPYLIWPVVSSYVCMCWCDTSSAYKWFIGERFQKYRKCVCAFDYNAIIVRKGSRMVYQCEWPPNDSKSSEWRKSAWSVRSEKVENKRKG